MTRRVLIQSQELDAAAEKVGGYVALPGSLKTNPVGEKEFTLIRRYCLQHKISMSKLSTEDYLKMGIKRK